MVRTKSIYLFILITSVIWGASLPLTYISGIGSVYPLRIILLLFLIYKIYELLINKFKIKTSVLEKRTNLKMFIMWLWIMAITLVMPKTSDTFSALVTYSTNILLIACVSFSIDNENDERAVYRTIILNALLQGGFATVEMVRGKWLFRTDGPSKWDVNFLGMVTPVTIFHNTNNLCMFIVCTLPIFFLLNNSRFHRAVYTLFVLYISLIASCHTGIIFVLVFYLYLFFFKVLVNNKKRMLFLIFGIIAIYFYAVFGDFSLTSSRLALWGMTLKNCLATKFLGVGTGNAAIYNANSSLSNVFSVQGWTINAVHNYLLEFLFETGIMGIALAAWWLIPVIRRSWNMRFSEKGLYIFGLIIAIICTSVCVSTMTDFFQYWMFLGIVISYVGRNYEGSSCALPEQGKQR